MRIFFLILLILGFCACTKKPNFLIPEHKMIEILTDIHVSEAALVNVSPSIKDSLAKQYYNQIFSIHQADSIKFKKCLIQYQHYPDMMDELYKKVVLNFDKLKK